MESVAIAVQLAPEVGMPPRGSADLRLCDVSSVHQSSYGPPQQLLVKATSNGLEQASVVMSILKLSAMGVSLNSFRHLGLNQHSAMQHHGAFVTGPAC